MSLDIKKEKTMSEDNKLPKTGFEQAGFRPLNNQIALILSNADLIVLGSPLAEKSKLQKPEKKSIITKTKEEPKIYKGEEAEKEEEETRKNNRTFTVAAISESIVEKSDAPQVGDEVSLLAGTMQEIIVNNKVYGIVPVHRILGIHKTKIN